MIPCAAHRLKLQLTCITTKTANTNNAAASSSAVQSTYKSIQQQLHVPPPSVKLSSSTRDPAVHSESESSSSSSSSSSKRPFSSISDSTNHTNPKVSNNTKRLLQQPQPPIQNEFATSMSEVEPSHVMTRCNCNDESSSSNGIILPNIDLMDDSCVSIDKKVPISSNPIASTLHPSESTPFPFAMEGFTDENPNPNLNQPRSVRPKLQHQHQLNSSKQWMNDNTGTLLEVLTDSTPLLPMVVSNQVESVDRPVPLPLLNAHSDSLPTEQQTNSAKTKSNITIIHTATTDDATDMDEDDVNETVSVFKSVRECINANRVNQACMTAPTLEAISNPTSNHHSMRHEDDGKAAIVSTVDGHAESTPIAESVDHTPTLTNAIAIEVESSEPEPSTTINSETILSSPPILSTTTALQSCLTETAVLPTGNGYTSPASVAPTSTVPTVPSVSTVVCHHPICLTCESRLDSLRSTNTSIVKSWNEGADQLLQSKKNAQQLQQQLQEIRQQQSITLEQLHQYQQKVKQYEDIISTNESCISCLNGRVSELQSSLDVIATDKKRTERQLDDIQHKFQAQSNLYKRFQSDFTRLQSTMESEINLQQKAAEQAKENLVVQQAEFKLSIEAAAKAQENAAKESQIKLDDLQRQHAESINNIQSQFQAQIQTLNQEVKLRVCELEECKTSFKLQQQMNEEEWNRKQKVAEEVQRMQQDQCKDEHEAQIAQFRATIQQMKTEREAKQARFRDSSKTVRQPITPSSKPLSSLPSSHRVTAVQNSNSTMRSHNTALKSGFVAEGLPNLNKNHSIDFRYG